MNFLIDSRETKLIDLVKQRGLLYTTANLEIGDVIISDSCGHQLIIERKTIADMVASVKDGRYKEQKLRLQAEQSRSNGKMRFAYVIEGDNLAKFTPADKLIAIGGIISSSFRDGIPVLRTMSLDETLDLILRLFERLSKDIKDFFQDRVTVSSTGDSCTPMLATATLECNNCNCNGSGNGRDSGSGSGSTSNSVYLQTIKKNKKENLTPDTWFHLSLTNIPGISSTIAEKIIETYPTLKALIAAYDACDTDIEKKQKLLAEIVLTQTEKTKRRIGNVISNRIYQYILYTTSPIDIIDIAASSVTSVTSANSTTIK